MRYYTVFNAEQADGLRREKQPEAAPSWQVHRDAEALIKGSGVKVRHVGGDRAYYQLSSDVVVMPEKGQFSSPDLYYQTTLHELGHASGHLSRLDRESLRTGLKAGFGSEEYAREELRAEISAGTATPGQPRRPGTPVPSPIRWRTSRPLSSVVVSLVRALQRYPQQRGDFFWISMTVSVCSSFLRSRRLSRSSSAMRWSRASFGRAFRPRFGEPLPDRTPASCCRRQALKFEPYRPSRRSNAPSSPGWLHWSASRTIRRL